MKISEKILSSSLTTVFASVGATFVVAYAFFKLAGPVPISVSQTTVEKKNTFDVSGEGLVTAVPNLAEINLGIRIEKMTVAEAQKEANRVINTIQDELKVLKIDEKDIKTLSYQVYPNYGPLGERRVTGYVVDTSLRVKVKDFDKINQVIDLGSKNGANQIGSLSFSLDEEDLEKEKNKAREEAVAKAKEKAKNLANISGVRLGKIISVQEDLPSAFAPRSLGGITLEAKDEETQIMPGSQEIKVIITLSYEII
ncbi:hypothetical protein COT75_05420 [Candidatus Beckwithbacteria bacterium CG10_big_fil_rev_8_21_14_0_10_34_10]|uniref:SIMPL domain-containing protein n=1 Tax=Candidatus Beckwithbacteria bacterium CG10_big_fil_rev_8_21_14_0_10_34_10 TaxID=1974495 RepID=A0A2H0W9V6_9BACT|nr:MAG: hypothetical protein COT75_05420 [Candidatus Beckwithbacteria bacterium CG10_big_fil_rev_8_21_14_0_10_34_10]